MIGCRVIRIKQSLFQSKIILKEGLEVALHVSSEHIVLVLEMPIIDSEGDVYHRDLKNVIKVKNSYRRWYDYEGLPS